MSLMADIKSEIKAYTELNDNQVRNTNQRNRKLNRRIEFASIFPPSTLVEFEQAVRDFDKVQKEQQGSISLKDTFISRWNDS